METFFLYILPIIVTVIIAVTLYRNDIDVIKNIFVILAVLLSLIPIFGIVVAIAALIVYFSIVNESSLNYGDCPKFNPTKINVFLYGEKSCKKKNAK